MWEPVTRNLSGNIPPHSSQVTKPLWTDPGIKSGTSVRELISTSKKKKKAQAENDWSNILPKSSQARKKPPLRRKQIKELNSEAQNTKNNLTVRRKILLEQSQTNEKRPTLLLLLFRLSSNPV